MDKHKSITLILKLQKKNKCNRKFELKFYILISKDLKEFMSLNINPGFAIMDNKYISDKKKKKKKGKLLTQGVMVNVQLIF